jgi:hypothetical protein
MVKLIQSIVFDEAPFTSPLPAEAVSQRAAVSGKRIGRRVRKI